jgi:translocation and assembly module TamB
LPLGEPRLPSRFALTLRDVDPASLHTRLWHARVGGRIEAQVDGARQSVSGTLADGRNELAFAATVEQQRLEVTSARLRAGDGAIQGSGTLALDGDGTFALRASASRFDPSRFVAMPASVLDGTLEARGTLRPALSLHAELAVKAGSRYAGLDIRGTARGDVALPPRGDPAEARSDGANASRAGAAVAARAARPWPRLRQLAVDATAGGARITLAGDAGAPGDRVAFTLDARRLSELAPWLPATWPRPVAGSASARGTVQVEPGGVGGDVDLHADDVRLSDGSAATRVALAARVAPGGAAAKPVALTARSFDVRLAATGMKVRTQRLDEAVLEVRGSLARHTLAVRVKGAGTSVQASASGSLVPGDRLAAAAWSGRIDAFDSSGAVNLHLRSPATLDVAGDRVRLAGAHVDIADGRADIATLSLVDGRLDTQGTFTGVPLLSVLALAGRPAPIGSTLVLGGEWSIAATPRLTGRFAVRRERGDLYAGDSQASGLAFGITALEASGTLRDDALAARATLRSTRAGNAQGELAIGSVAGAAQGRLSADAPLSATLEVELASLTPLQTLIGTQAVVNGRLHAALRATGTLGSPVITGSVDGDALRIDAAQYGVHVKDGRLRARLAEGAVTLEELSFAGGEGRFTARGRLAEPGRAGGSHVEWHAEHFEVADRPDLRLVLAGDGTLALADKRVTLSGEVRVEKGHVEYEASPPGRLGPDVVVKGRAALPPRDAGMRNLPLSLDLDVELGRELTFAGEGLDAGLAGRVKVTTDPTGTLRGRGTIRTLYGSYYAFGQKLTIDRGRLIFDGPLDNPALDVVALRKNLPVEAGVALTGTVKVPLVRITSNPPVPENEALAWLITGQGLSGAGRSDYAALSAAAGALLGRKGKPITTRIAERIGLDDISLQSSGTATGTSTSPVAGQVVVLGKRISDRLTLGYEQGLSLASGALRLEYALSRTLTLRAEAGVISGIGLFYRRSFR